jgi:hypothetical protein
MSGNRVPPSILRPAHQTRRFRPQIQWVNEPRELLFPKNLTNIRGSSLLNLLDEAPLEEEEREYHKGQVIQAVLEMLQRKPLYINPIKHKHGFFNSFEMPPELPANTHRLIAEIQSRYPDVQSRLKAVEESNFPPFVKWVLFEKLQPRPSVNILAENQELQNILYDYITAIDSYGEQMDSIDDEDLTEDERRVLEEILYAINLAKKKKLRFAAKRAKGVKEAKGGSRKNRRTRRR